MWAVRGGRTQEPGHWLERFCPVTLVGRLGGLLVPEVWCLENPLQTQLYSFVPRWKSKEATSQNGTAWPCLSSAQPFLLSSETGSDETPKACRSSSSKGFLEPCLTGRVLADGTLFPVNENKTNPALVLAGSGAQGKYPFYWSGAC